MKTSRRRRSFVVVLAPCVALLLSLCIATPSLATEKDDGGPVDPAVIRAAVAKSLPLLERSSRISVEKRKQCFTCHNTGLPIQAVTVAAPRGFTIDRDNLQAQAKFTADFLARNRDNYRQGKGQGGQAHTAGYALWALENAGWKPDETTAAVAEYLLVHQKDQDFWKAPSNRPPSEGSAFATSYVALRALKHFGTPEQRERVNARVKQVREWLLATKPKDTEDAVFRLLALHAARAGDDEVRRAAGMLIKAQQPDGGWRQLDTLKSDAYATGTALFALRETGALAVTDSAYQNGLKFLLAGQLSDGSWHVATRSKPIQTYYESGYPHEKDQFVSITAAGWATTVLALALPVEQPKEATRP